MLLNGKTVSIPAGWLQGSLLEFLRDGLGQTGTKFGCGRGLCGACTVHIGGDAVRSCITPLASVADAEVTTIEGLAGESDLHPVQQAWVELNVPQCGYCQPGQIMTAAAFLKVNENPTPAEVESAMSANLCRCGTHQRIRQGVLLASVLMQTDR